MAARPGAGSIARIAGARVGGGLAVVAPKRKRTVETADTTQQVGEILKMVGDDVDHLILLLHPPMTGDHPCRHHQLALLGAVGTENQVGDTGFVLDGDT